MKASQLEILPKIEKTKNEKRARLLTLILLIVTVIPSFTFWLIAKLQEKKINFPKPAVKIKAPQIGSGKTSDLSLKLSRWAAEAIAPLPGKWAVRVELLTDDFVWGINDQDQFVAASLIKLPVVAAFYRQVERGKLSLEETYVLKEKDKVAGAGSLQYRPAGTELTLGQLASLALSQSDNTAFKILRRKIGEQEINRLMTQWGMTKTDLEENLTSAADVALFFRRLYQGEIVNQEFRQRMLNDLTKRSNGFECRHCNTDEFATCVVKTLNLAKCGLDVFGSRRCHRLHDHRIAAAYFHTADIDNFCLFMVCHSDLNFNAFSLWRDACPMFP